MLPISFCNRTHGEDKSPTDSDPTEANNCFSSDETTIVYSDKKEASLGTLTLSEEEYVDVDPNSYPKEHIVFYTMQNNPIYIFNKRCVKFSKPSTPPKDMTTIKKDETDDNDSVKGGSDTHTIINYTFITVTEETFVIQSEVSIQQ